MFFIFFFDQNPNQQPKPTTKPLLIVSEGHKAHEAALGKMPVIHEPSKFAVGQLQPGFFYSDRGRYMNGFPIGVQKNNKCPSRLIIDFLDRLEFLNLEFFFCPKRGTGGIFFIIT